MTDPVFVDCDVREGLEFERRAMRETVGTPNQLETVRADLEKRAPLFLDSSPREQGGTS